MPRYASFGPKSAVWLADIGIHAPSELAGRDLVAIYLELKARRPRDINLNMLWALAGWALDCHWAHLPPDLKASLREEVAARSAEDPLAAHPPLRSLLAAFEGATLPAAAWTHREHLEVAVALLALAPLEAAIDRFRAGLSRLNEAHGMPQTDAGGYHETLTQVYLRLIDAHLRALPATTGLPDRVASVVAAFSDKLVVLEYYSRDLVMSREARYGWAAPDLRAIPGVPFVRPATPDDDRDVAAAVAALHEELRAFEPTVRPGAEVAGYAEGLREACVATGGAVFVATVDGAPIGFAAVRLERGAEARWNAVGDVAYLSDTRDDPAWRGRGVERLLLGRVEAHARAAGAAQLRLMAMAGDQAGRAFYERAGFSDLRAVMARPL